MVVRAQRRVDPLLSRPAAGHLAGGRSARPSVAGQHLGPAAADVVGLGTTLSPTETGTLFLKINDSAGELDDNSGELKVEVRAE